MPAPTSSAERDLSILQSFVPSMRMMYCTGPWLSMLSGSVSSAERDPEFDAQRAVALNAQRQRIERGAPVAVAVRKGRCAADEPILRDVIPITQQRLKHAGIADIAPVAVLPVGREAVCIAVAEAEDLDHAAHLTSGSR